jgi:hypothetical protein
MPLTIDEIQKAVGEQPELKSSIITSLKDDFTKGLEAEGVIIRTKDQEAQYLKSYEEKVIPVKVEEKFSERFKATHDEIDNAVTELTGEKKGPHEKTTEFAKRAFKAFHSKGGDPVTKEKVAQLEKLLSDKETEWSNKYNEAVTQAEKREIDLDAEKGLTDKQYPFPAHIKTDEEKQKYSAAQKRFIKNDFLSSFTPKRDSEGNIVYYESNKPLMSTKDGKPLSAAEIIADRYSSFFMQNGREVTGTGQGKTVIVTKGNFTTKDDIHKYLAASGMEASTKEYMDEFKKLADEAKISI